MIMSLEINKSEQYVVYKPLVAHFDDELSSQIEKAIAKSYGGEGNINFIIDLASVSVIDPIGFALFQKVQKICHNESGLFVLVSTNEAIVDLVASNSEEFILFLPSLEEAIDAVFMNELENDFKEEEEDEFGFEGENEY
jgi:anti-anti-sigma regulatory factor